MEGKILGFDQNLNEGIIVSDDGKRYKFDKEDWREKSLPRKGLKVDFEVQNNKATNIYMLEDIGTNITSLAEGVYTNAANKNILKIYIDVIKKHYFDFDGRTRRRTFWLFTLMDFIIMIFGTLILSYLIAFILSLFGNSLNISEVQELWSILLMIYLLGVTLPRLSIIARRLHDIGKSGWWQLISVIPVIGPIVLLIWFATKSDPLPNQYGEVPVNE